MKTTGTSWPHVLADLEAKHQALGAIITMVRTHFVDEATPGEMPDSTPPAPKPRRKGKRAAKTSGRKKRIEKRQTDRQTEQRAGHRAARSLPKREEKSEAILSALKSNNGSLLLRELAKVTGAASTTTLNYRMKGLVKAKAVILTGVTAGRRASLPGRVPKEDL